MPASCRAFWLLEVQDEGVLMKIYSVVDLVVRRCLVVRLPSRPHRPISFRIAPGLMLELAVGAKSAPAVREIITGTGWTRCLLLLLLLLVELLMLLLLLWILLLLHLGTVLLILWLVAALPVAALLAPLWLPLWLALVPALLAAVLRPSLALTLGPLASFAVAFAAALTAGTAEIGILVDEIEQMSRLLLTRDSLRERDTVGVVTSGDALWGANRTDGSSRTRRCERVACTFAIGRRVDTRACIRRCSNATRGVVTWDLFHPRHRFRVHTRIPRRSVGVVRHLVT